MRFSNKRNKLSGWHKPGRSTKPTARRCSTQRRHLLSNFTSLCLWSHQNARRFSSNPRARSSRERAGRWAWRSIRCTVLLSFNFVLFLETCNDMCARVTFVREVRERAGIYRRCSLACQNGHICRLTTSCTWPRSQLGHWDPRCCAVPGAFCSPPHSHQSLA